LHTLIVLPDRKRISAGTAPSIQNTGTIGTWQSVAYEVDLAGRCKVFTDVERWSLHVPGDFDNAITVRVLRIIGIVLHPCVMRSHITRTDRSSSGTMLGCTECATFMATGGDQVRPSSLLNVWPCGTLESIRKTFVSHPSFRRTV
jgi:hypothetical protein